MQDSTVFYIPKDFPGAYRKIIKLKIVRSKLTEIHRADISQFPGLKILVLRKNELQSLETDLFHSNLDLERVDLSFNQIWFVEQDAFKDMNQLRDLNFERNRCYDYRLTDPRYHNAVINKECFSLERQAEWKNTRSYEIIELAKENEKLMRKDRRRLEEVAEYEDKLFRLKRNLDETNFILKESKNKLEELNATLEAVNFELDLYKSNSPSVIFVQDQINKLNKTVIKLLQKFEASHSQDNIVPDSSTSNALIHVHTSFIVILIVLFIIAFMFLYYNRSNIMVMNRSYKIPSDDEVPRIESSVTLNYGLSIDDLCEKQETQTENTSERSRKDQASTGKASRNDTLSSNETSLKSDLDPPPIPARSRQNSTKRKSVNNLIDIEEDLHEEKPKVPPKNSVVYSTIKKQLEQDPSNPYGQVWKANSTDDEYVELQEKILFVVK